MTYMVFTRNHKHHVGRYSSALLYYRLQLVFSTSMYTVIHRMKQWSPLHFSSAVHEETKCHIHFPDSNRSLHTDKSNQVSITGQEKGVELARKRIRVRGERGKG